MNPMGILGGTFDPIHYAHLRTAFELQQALRLKEIRFLPAGNPPHRDQPLADPQLRLKMVQAATAGQPGFVVDDREVRKEGPSYSVETLAELRHEYPDRSLCMIVGMDAFLSLPKWHQWRELLQLAHLVVAHRPGWRAPGMGPLGRTARRSRHRTHRRSARIARRMHLHPCGHATGNLVHGCPSIGRHGPRSALPDAGFGA